MSAPMPSLKSSMGSKGSNLLCNDPAYLCSNDERAIALRSSWINRLHLHLPFDRALATPKRSSSTAAAPHSPCTTTGSGLGHKRTISTDESRTTTSIPDLNSTFVRRYFNIFSRDPPPPPPPPPVAATEVRIQGGGGRVTGFGPFQVRTRKTFLQSVDAPRVGDHVQNGGFPFFRVSAAAGGGDEKSKLRSMAAEEDRDPANRSFMQPRSARLSPFFQFPLPPPAGPKTIDKGKRILSPDRAGSSYNQGCLRPVCIENGRPPVPFPYLLPRDSVNEQQRLLVDPWRASTSSQRPVRSKGGLYHGTFDDTAQFWPHAKQNSHVLHHNSLQLHSQRQNPVVLHEPEEPFSYWNMGRFNKKTTVSSVVPPTAFAGNLGRKRHSNTDDFVPAKSRKLRIEN